MARIRSVDYINDSKATNVNATWYALESCNTPVVWIAGGIDKGNDYSKLSMLIKEKVKAIICLGSDNQNIIQAFKNDVGKIYETQRMEDAVDLAYKVSQPGETVLLSPACASFDLFANYEDRGNQFKEFVKNL
ncbi:MAG: UDP-N-acetylmuramoylalanine--D-glutamate ligase [Bacteroidetes bacterium ADurb.Bin408]|nr:MAG: UDP-N-acetylmuramoylalanine--D-glutamate ligase [Bacteroidetes bacterium ADurb.Bin408]